jgi:integrase
MEDGGQQQQQAEPSATDSASTQHQNTSLDTPKIQPPLPSLPIQKRGKITNPQYRKFMDGDYLLIATVDHINKAIDTIKTMRKRNEKELIHFLIIIYYTGARPAEILKLNRESFKIEGRELSIDIQTLKRGSPRKNLIPMRHALVKQLWQYVSSLPPYTPIFDKLCASRLLPSKKKDGTLSADKNGLQKFHTDTTYKVYNHFKHVFDGTELEGIPPYYLRHSRFTAMSEKGASIQDIKYWKGAKSIDSVNPYMHRSLAQAKKTSRLID